MNIYTCVEPHGTGSAHVHYDDDDVTILQGQRHFTGPYIEVRFKELNLNLFGAYTAITSYETCGGHYNKFAWDLLTSSLTKDILKTFLDSAFDEGQKSGRNEIRRKFKRLFKTEES